VREPVGSYGSLSSTYTRGVNIHRYRGSGYNRTTFIRSLYDDGSGSGATLEFVDVANEITITQLADNGDGTVDVRVDFNLECLAAPPSVNISPAIAASAPGGSDDFNVTVTNRDTSVCDPRAFEVAMDVNTPLSPSPSIDTTNVLAPGAAVTLSFTVGANGAQDGTYGVSAEAYDATDTTMSLASYMVDGSPPDAPVLSASLTRKNRASLSWTASQDAGVGLDHYEVYSNGTLLATTTSTSYNHTGLASGTTYSYVVDAVDGADNAASSNTAEVITASKGGGGGGNDGGGGGGGGGNKGKKPPK
jgi:hypothetical protein